MRQLSRNAFSVKRRGQKPPKRAGVLRFVELQIEAARAFETEMQLYAMWLRHGLVPAERVVMLMSAEQGGVQ